MWHFGDRFYIIFVTSDDPHSDRPQMPSPGKEKGIKKQKRRWQAAQSNIAAACRLDRLSVLYKAKGKRAKAFPIMRQLI